MNEVKDYDDMLKEVVFVLRKYVALAFTPEEKHEWISGESGQNGAVIHSIPFEVIGRKLAKDLECRHLQKTS